MRMWFLNLPDILVFFSIWWSGFLTCFTLLVLAILVTMWSGSTITFTSASLVKFFNNDFVLEDWKDDKPIAVCNFDKRTPYKFWDDALNGNYLIVYQQEWGDLF